MIMNLYHDEPKVVSTMSFSKSRETTQPAGLSEEEMPTPGLALPPRATNLDDSKIPFVPGMNNSYALSTILSSILEQSSSRQSFQMPIQVEHDILSSPSTLQQQISALNNAELLQLLIHQKTFGSSLFNSGEGNMDVLPVGLGAHNLSNSPASSIPSFGMLQSSSAVGKAPRECGNAGLRVLCPARGMPADHDFERAHFTITPDMKHGEELRCSHPVCQAGGVKFCYCAICKKPAAKRNFRGRHHHIEEDPRLDSTKKDFSDSLQRDDATLPTVSAPQPSLIESINNMVCGGVDSKKAMMMRSIGAQHKQQWGKVVDGAASHPSPITTKSDARLCIVVSCKARGMPSDHNSNTAYFVMSPTTQHGEDLLCSYESCNSAGSKFSFCAYCRVPVARRGFRAHCLQSGHDSGSSSKGLSTGSRELSSENNISDASRDGNPNDRIEKWDRLLGKRPSKEDREGLASWIKQVLDVSSIGTVMEEDDRATSASEKAGSEEEIITALIDSIATNHETSHCDSNDMNPKQPKQRKLSF